jgi:DNA adenine methylase
VVRSFMGFGSDSASGAKTGFRANGNRQTAHPAKDWSNYPAAVEGLLRAAARRGDREPPGLEIIRQHDEPETLHYCDPPYLHEHALGGTLRTGKGYRHEMTDDAPPRLAEVLHAAPGMVVLSGYACDLYDRELYADWAPSSARPSPMAGSERLEVLWLNEACAPR